MEPSLLHGSNKYLGYYSPSDKKIRYVAADELEDKIKKVTGEGMSSISDYESADIESTDTAKKTRFRYTTYVTDQGLIDVKIEKLDYPDYLK